MVLGRHGARQGGGRPGDGLAAVSITATIGFAGLVVDVGSWYQAQRQARAAASGSDLGIDGGAIQLTQ